VEASALSHPVGLGRVSLAGPLLRLRTDDQLVALFRAGHDEAFGTIHDRYRQRLFAYARQMLGGSRSDAEDVLQDVFLRAYHALRADTREVALRAWLYRVAHNRCIDQLRRPTPNAEDIYDLNRVAEADPETAAERRESLRRLIADVRALPEQQRSALLMREMEGLSYNDLAAALEVTVPAVKSLLVRARVGLVEAIEARDTACVEIRDDLDAAFSRGVRASGRSRRHLRECAGCRDYRDALRSVEKTLNGLAPSAGPLSVLAKILGLGGAGSGGGAVAFGGGAGATAGAGAVGTGAVATKVAAVVATAAVVGGGAATVERVEHAVQRPAAVHRSHTVVKHPAPQASVPAAQRTVAAAQHLTVPASVKPATRKAAAPAPAPTRATHVRAATGTAVSSTGHSDAPALEPTSGGLEAPADDATTASATTPPTDPGGSGTATAGTGTDATTGAGSTAAATTDPSATPATPAPTTSATSPSTASGPSGTVSPGAGGPVAQGAAAAPAG
jgi:RNA polymerase sigma factor (sigma-70 family)